MKLQSEDLVRQLAKEITDGYSRVDIVDFVDPDTQMLQQAPLGLIPDLEKYVKHMLDTYDKHGMLTWHNNTIPASEIWIKIGEAMEKNR